MSTPTISSPTPSPNRKKVTTSMLREKKKRAQPISMLTAYDYPTAQILDRAEIDAILVGNSLGMVVLGYANTLPVTMEEMLHHCRAVSRGSQFALLIGDMPFLSYQVSTSEAIRNSGRFLQEAGMDAVKLEGGRERLEAVRAIVSAGIPVMGHLGLTPQSVHQLGGFKPQGRTAEAARAIVEDALAAAGGGLLQPGAGVDAHAPGRVYLQTARNPDHRHRRRCRLRRAGAGHARCAWAVRPLYPALRKNLCAFS